MFAQPQQLLGVALLLLAIGCPRALGRKTEKRCVNCTYRTYYTYGDGRSLQRVVYQNPVYTRASQTYGCSGNPCGVNAVCQEAAGGRPVCSCPPGYSGNPLTHCNRGECLDNVDCRGDLQCKDNRCVNPCVGACGIGSNCEARNHVAVCSCPAGYNGDPYTACHLNDPAVSQPPAAGPSSVQLLRPPWAGCLDGEWLDEEQCHPSPCGVNTKCEIINGVPTCSCLHGYLGNPLSGCRHECEHDGDCGGRDMCSNYKCVPSCGQCGIGANCKTVANHRAVCECPKGYIGSPYTECRPECYGDSDCPAGRPACFYGICKNTCEGACGVGADCNLRGLTPVCSCPRDMTGDPFVRCRPFTKEDLCEPNPCGTNAICVPGHDNTGRERPVCNCLPGHTGNPLSHCSRGECLSNNECPDHRACINYQCVDPCIGKCATGASCEAKAHLAVCRCPHGQSGDALVSCRQTRTFPVAKYH